MLENSSPRYLSKARYIHVCFSCLANHRLHIAYYKRLSCLCFYTHNYFCFIIGKRFGPWWVKMRTDKERILLRRKIFSFLLCFSISWGKKVFCDSVVADHKLDPTFAIVWQCRRVCKMCQFSPLGTIPYTWITMENQELDENICTVLKENQINIVVFARLMIYGSRILHLNHVSHTMSAFIHLSGFLVSQNQNYEFAFFLFLTVKPFGEAWAYFSYITCAPYSPKERLLA